METQKTIKHENQKTINTLIVRIGVFVFLCFFVFVANAKAVDLGTTWGGTLGLSTQDIRVTIANFIQIVLGFLGMIALILVLYAGFLWMTSAGDREKIEKAKQILVSAVIGLIIILSAYAITTFIISKLESALGTSSSGPPPPPPPPPPPFVSSFYVMPGGITPTGVLLIRNVEPRIIFNSNVDASTISGNIAITHVTSSVPVLGTFTAIGKVVKFKPNDFCPPPNGALRCFEALSDYRVDVLTGLKNTGGISLSSSVSGTFTTGSLVDTEPPAVSLKYLTTGASVSAAFTVTLSASSTDDAGLASVEFYIDGAIPSFPSVAIASVSGTSSDAFGTWDTTAYTIDNHTNYAKVYDGAGNEATSYTATGKILPAHCFDVVKNFDELDIDCGGADCLLCSGSYCTSNAQCSGGLCEANKCVNAPLIDGVSQLDGAPGNFVTVYGRNFETFSATSSVVFLGTDDDGSDNATSTFPSAVNPACTNFWTNNSVVVVIPAGAVSGPVKITADSNYNDTTDNDRGVILPNFTINTTARPGLCAVSPGNGEFGDGVVLDGVFGATAGDVYFGSIKSDGIISWTNLQITGAKVPNVKAGNTGTQVKVGGELSNLLPFTVKASATLPKITGFEPIAGPVGQYVTITGSNFGANTGTVYFKGISGKILADTSFPAQCGSIKFWKDNQILVKVPVGADTDFISITTQKSISATSTAAFTVNALSPTPGLCKLDPDNGPANMSINVYGENFGALAGDVKFYDDESAVFGSWTGQQIISAIVPSAAKTGPVVVENSSAVLSNPLNFAVGACSATSCLPGDECCPSGSCKPTGTCAAAPLSCSYSWSFTTGVKATAPAVRDVSTCASGLQSPSPYKNFKNACLNSSIAASFNMNMDDTTLLNASNYLLQECLDGEPCTSLSADVKGAPVIGITNPGLDNEGIVFAPPLLKPTQWYLATLLSGIGNMQMPQEFIATYTWKFLTSTSACAIDRVELTPSNVTLTSKGSTQNYLAAPLAKTCNILSGSYLYDWSIDNVSIATILPVTLNSNTATAQAEGETTVRVEEQSGHKKDSSFLRVDFVAPRVILKRPTCDKACLNAEVGADFNVGVALTPANAKLYLCPDSSCVVGPLDDTGSTLTNVGLTKWFFNSGTLAPNTNYRVVLNDTIVSVDDLTLVGLNYDSNADSIIDSYSWTFKSKDTACLINNVDVAPATAKLTIIDETQNYSASAFSSADACEPTGQKLNASSFNWVWTSSLPAVATVSNDDTNPVDTRVDAMQKATAVGDGTTNIIATASSVSGSGILDVETDYPNITGVSPDNGISTSTITTLVTISGSNFGASQGTSKILIGGKEAKVAKCNGAWSDTVVVVELPITLANGIYDVKITTSRGDDTAVNAFTVNNTARPGICSISPDYGRGGDKVTITGVNFGDTQGNSKVYFNGVAVAISSWNNTTIGATATGTIALNPVKANVEFQPTVFADSNEVPFKMSPYITLLSPDKGKEGQYVTIFGGNFGTSGVVTFDGTAAAYPNPICKNTWTDTQIIVKVPVGATTGLVKVTNNYLVTSEDIDSKTFTIDNNIPVGPNLCELDPSFGNETTPVDVKGDNLTGSYKFTFNKTDASFSIFSDSWIDTTVPVGATTGKVKAAKSVVVGQKCSTVTFFGSCLFGIMIDVYADIYSNEIYFEVPICGNNIKETTEACDDGNTVNGDTCSSTCQISYVPKSCQAASVGLVGEWKMDEGTGATISDSSGKGNNGNITGAASWTTLSKNGSALVFENDGTVTIANNPALDITGELTLEAWINPKTPPLPTIWRQLIGKGQAADPKDVNYDLWYSPSGTLRFSWGGGGIIGSGDFLDSTSTTPLNEWTHVVGTIDSANNVKLYLNGVLSNAKTTIKARVAVASALDIGGYPAYPAYKIGIDEVKIYNRALSDVEVVNNYNFYACLAKKCSVDDTGIIERWLLDEGSGTTVYGTQTAIPAWVTGAKWTGGKNGLALDFNGVTNDYVNLGNRPSFDVTDALTIETWINAEDVTSANADTGIVTKGSYIYSITRGETVGVNNNRRLYAYINSGGNSITTFIDLDVWQHVVFTYDRNLPSQNMKLYVNGDLKDSKNYTNPITTTAADLYLGSNNGVQYFNGLIDETTIYNRALSADEIKSRYDCAISKGRETYQILSVGTTTCPNGKNQITFDRELNESTLSKITIVGAPVAYSAADLSFVPETLGVYTIIPKVSSPFMVNNTYTLIIPGGVTGILGKDNTILGNPNNGNNYDITWTTGPDLCKIDNLQILSEGAGGVIKSGLVAYWPIDTEFGIDIPDVSGNNNNGKLINGPVSVPGRVNRALKLDGIDDYIDFGVDNPSATEIDGDKLTLSAWIKTSNSDGYIMSKNGPYFLYVGSNTLGGSIYTGGTWTSTGGSQNIADNVWHYVSLVYNGVDVRLYVDGVLDNTPIAKTGNLASSGGCMQMGRWNNGFCDGSPGNYFQGLLDEAVIYNRALLPDEIISNYQGGLGIITKDYFNCAENNCPGDADLGVNGNQHRYQVKAYDKDNVELIIAPGDYNWQLDDADTILNLSSLTGTPNNIFPNKKDGDALVKVSTKQIDSEEIVAQSVNVDVFLCKNPWPSRDKFPFVDEEYNFKLFYCRGESKNLIENSSFENNPANLVPYGWNVSGKAEASTDKLYGEKAVEVSYVVSTNSSLSYMLPYQFIGGDTYTASVWCKTDIGKKCVISFEDIGGPDPGDNKEQAEVNSTGAWQRIFVTHTFSHDEPSGVVAFKVYAMDLLGNPLDSVLYDGAQVEEGSVATEYMESTLLPYIIASGKMIGKGEVRDEYLFTVPESGDAIGLRIMNNTSNSSPQVWYSATVPNPGSPSLVTVGKYHAAQDGRSVYVNAANVVPTSSTTEDIYTNVYLASYNDAANSDTTKIYSELLKNVRFNQNVSLFKQTDYVNYTYRLEDLAYMNQLLQNYKDTHGGAYPTLVSGTFIKGNTYSTWPSWQQTLGKELGATLPVDPINQFNYNNQDILHCQAAQGYDTKTCWNEKLGTFDEPVDSLGKPRFSYYYFYKDGVFGFSALKPTGFGCGSETMPQCDVGSGYCIDADKGSKSCHPYVSGMMCTALSGTPVFAADEVCGGKVYGYAWGPTIGWIKMQQKGAGVLVSGSGNLYGYAWNVTAGWINFEGTQIQTDGTVIGEATILSLVEKVATTTAPLPVGSDKIKMQGTTYGTQVVWGADPMDPGKGVFTGYGWSPYFGWIYFGVPGGNVYTKWKP